MSHRTFWSVSGCTALFAATLIAAAESQRRPAGQTPAKQGIQVSLKIGAQTYQSNEPGKCTHAPVASIYQIVSELWTVQQSADGRSLSLSFWRPKDGAGDMVTFSVTSGNTSHEINTVRGGGAMSGSGKVTFARSGAGGTFTIDAKTRSGVAIAGAITCDAFAPHVAEGGFDLR